MSLAIAIICGGFSSEYEISVKSARNIQNNLPKSVSSYLVFLRKDGWYVEVNSQEVDFDSQNFSFEFNGVTTKLNSAIVYIHGDPGENGKLQAYLDIIDIPYFNSGPLASQLSFDKWFCNQFLKGFGIKVARSFYLDDRDDIPMPAAIIENLGLPVFVKPCDSGSSYGISKVSEKDQLSDAISAAFDEGDTVLLESNLSGTEVTCAAYRNKDGICTLPLTEIVTENDFFDYEAKYLGKSEEITPARINEDIAKEVQSLSKRIYALLKLRSIARIDYMLVENEIYVIEVNTTPGFSNESIVPKMIQESDKSMTEFWAEIIEFESESNISK